jgi:uncharacterized Ntn-hydrolase superfamily protein
MKPKIKGIIVIAVMLVSLSALVHPSLSSDRDVLRPVNTYSIVARDSITGEMGVAVQSHWFSVGTVVTWAEAGVGAVATQSLAEISYGPLGLELMRAGRSADKTLKALLLADDHPEWRQVAMVDAKGNIAIHTGGKCIAEAGHRSGAQYSVQANLMEKNTVWDAMAEAYENTEGDLAERMLAALEAAQNEKGDIRGKQSAAILIVKAESSGRPYLDKVMDIRIEDHPEPIKELRRIIEVSRAYDYMNKGDELMAEGDLPGAMEAYNKAMKLAPGNSEVQFWAAVTMFTEGNEQEALEYFKEVFKADRNWIEVIKRLPEAGLLPVSEEQMQNILSAAP